MKSSCLLTIRVVLGEVWPRAPQYVYEQLFHRPRIEDDFLVVWRATLRMKVADR